MAATANAPLPAVRAPRGLDWLLGALLALPLAAALEKLLFAKSAFAGFLSLEHLPMAFQRAVENVLFVPLGAVVVVLFRLTLGIRVLSLFRPILLAMAFAIIGVPLALGFLAFSLAVVVSLRPPLRPLHSYARVAVLLSLVGALMLLPLMAGTWWDVPWLREIAFFPVIALCLTCESFAKVLDREGFAAAARRTGATILAAWVTFVIASAPGTLELFLHFPELLLAQAGLILLITRYLDLRLLAPPQDPFAFQERNP